MFAAEKTHREMTETVPKRVPATIRLRSAGFGVIVGGVGLGLLSVAFPYSLAAGTLIFVSLVVGVVGRSQGTWLVQLCLGIGAIGLIGWLEAETTVGFGLTPGQLAFLAVGFGLLDVILGTALHQIQETLDGNEPN